MSNLDLNASSVSPTIDLINLNCLVLGDDPSCTFQVEIALTATVSALKKLIKEEKKNAFRDVDADSLQLWKVNLSVENEIRPQLQDNDKISRSPMLKLSKFFSGHLDEEHVHVIIQPPHLVSSISPAVDLISLNCLVLGDDPNRIFPVKIAQTGTVGDLKELIKEKKKNAFRDVDADSLQLWKVDLRVDDNLEDILTANDSFVQLGLPKRPQSSLAKLNNIFTKPHNEDHLHIIIKRSPDDVPSDVRERDEYMRYTVPAPSTGAKPSEFREVQEKKEYLCNRPRKAAAPVPVTLLESIFAEFIDNCDHYQPTAEDNGFVRGLSEKMCSFYKNELERMDVFRKELYRYGIPLAAASVGSTKYSTDGHQMSPNPNFVQVIIEGKNEIGSLGAEPFAQSLLYYRRFLQGAADEIIRLRFIAPCLHIIVFGACIGIAGSVFTHKVQCDVLVPVIPLFWHSTDITMQAMTARTFGALKIAINGLKARYPTILPTSPTNIPVGCPYPQQYTDLTTGCRHEFLYCRNQVKAPGDQLIFFGETIDGAQKICIKFVRHYSRDAHLFCASKGHAPKLIAYEHLHGGWKMVVMDVLRIDNRRVFPRKPGSFRRLDTVDVSDRQPLEKHITSLIQELHKHNGGYVHGDLRDTNFFLGDNTDFMLLDFDWAGQVDKTYYPMNVNVKQIDRPDGVQDGKKILVEHDLYMVKRLFHEQQEEPALKRRRVLSNTASES